MKRACMLLFALLGTFTAGCVSLYYGYPSLSYIPGLDLGPLHDNVYVFRVDVADDGGSLESAQPGHYQLQQVHASAVGSVPAQSLLAMDSAAIGPGTKTEHTIRLRLYRAGYELIEVAPWQTSATLDWKAATDPASQENAVDALLRPTGHGSWTAIARTAGNKSFWQFRELDPGSVSSEHRHALLFASTEYERLAAALTIDGAAEVCQRCQAKAKWLRDLADR